MRVIVQPLPMNPTLPVNPTPMVVPTVLTSIQMSAVKPTATTGNTTPIPATVYSLAQSRIQETPNPPIRKFQRDSPPSVMVTIPLRCSSPKLQLLPQPCRPERTPHGQLPCQPLLTCLSQGHHGQFPQVKPQHPYSLKKKKQKDPTKDSCYPPCSGKQATPNKAETMCRWGLHCPICAKSTPNPKAETCHKTVMVRDKTSWKKTIIPKAHSILHHMAFCTGSLSIIEQKKTGRRDWNFSKKNTI